MVFRTWICIVAMVSWSALGVACTDTTPDHQVEMVAQGLTAAGPLDAIQLCGLVKGVDCADGTYCRHHDGACGDTSIGWCAPVSDMCTMQYDPVCGCDGETYGNECTMMGAAVSMAHEGTCEPGCNWDAECAAGQTCDVQGCGEASGGACVKVPLHCNRMWAPVCGCDGETYSNDCHRLKAGVGLDHKGVCALPCGGIAGFQCAGSDDVCYYPDGTCDIVDNMGVCEEPPKICPKTTDPVCGCDGTSYRNACMMKRHGASMDHPGMCCKPTLCLVGEAVDTDGDGCGDFCPPADGCEGPNPAGCKNTGCDDGETCTFGLDCTASICFCDTVTGVWNCTKDCGGGVCVADEPVDLCADYTPPGCVQTGCDDGFVCDQFVGCVPSVCNCDPETGMAMCTMDCGGGTCVPEGMGSEPDSCGAPGQELEPVDCTAAGDENATCVFSNHCMCSEGYVCEVPYDDTIESPECAPGSICVPEDSAPSCDDPNPQACKAGDCDAGYTCDLSFGCSPSNCNCWEDADGVGHWNCTKDCKPGVCVPDDLSTGCCVDDVHCDVGQMCVNGGPNSVGVCKQLPPLAWPATSCWSDQGCPDGETCDGGSVCPCDAVCILPDSSGLCSGGDGGPGEPDQPENPE